MAKKCQVTAKTDFVTKRPCPCHLKVKMTRNVQHNIINEFNVPKSVKLEVSHLDDTLNKKKNVIIMLLWMFIMDGGGHI